MSIRTFLKEPLAHFLLLGALIFAGYELMNQGEESQPGKIVVTQGRIDSLRASFNRVWQRPPTSFEMDGLIRDFIREEVLAREAMALGLDLDDTVIRRRLRQKMEFLANDLSVPAEPTETELEEFLAEHSELFLIEPRFTFRQVYLNPEQRRDAVQQNAATLLTELNQLGEKTDFRMLGDWTMLNPELIDVSASEVSRQFGEEFTRQLEQLSVGRWHGPVTSGYGIHLVFIEDRKPGKIPKLAKVREEVVRAWADERRREDREQFYQDLLKRYAVTIEDPSPDGHGNALAAQTN